MQCVRTDLISYRVYPLLHMWQYISRHQKWASLTRCQCIRPRFNLKVKEYTEARFAFFLIASRCYLPKKNYIQYIYRG